MHGFRLLASAGNEFSDAREALEHIGEKMLSAGMVKASYPAALIARENAYPTGIALEKHAVAIPHCDAEHAIEPAVYLIRPARPVPFAQADDDGEVPAALIIALVVTHPSQQLSLLRALFGRLQEPEFVESLLAAPESEMGDLFRRRLLASET